MSALTDRYTRAFRAPMRAAEAAYLAGDTRTAERLAADAAHAARSSGDLEGAVEAAALQRCIRLTETRIAMTGWGTR